MLIDWSDKYSIGIPRIDEQHSCFVRPPSVSEQSARIMARLQRKQVTPAEEWGAKNATAAGRPRGHEARVAKMRVCPPHGTDAAPSPVGGLNAAKPGRSEFRRDVGMKFVTPSG